MALKDLTNFLSSINNKGILKSNKYIAEIEFGPDHYLRSRKGASILEEGELFRVRCDSLQLPGFTFATIEGAPRLGYGPLVRQPYAVQQYDEMTLSFIVDANSRIHRLFYDWANCIVNFRGGEGARKLTGATGTQGTFHSAYEVGYHDKYYVNMTITVYQTGAPKGAETQAAMKIHVYDAIPLSFPPIQLNWEDHQPIKLNIPFSYTDFSIEYIKE